MAEWYEVKLSYRKFSEDGKLKSVTEQYVVDALSFTEAETRILKEVGGYTSEPLTIKAIKKASYKEVFTDDNLEDGKWYKVKLQFITIDEKTEKEKKSNVIYLVQARSLIAACKAVDAIMSSSMMDYESMLVQETNIVDVFKHE